MLLDFVQILDFHFLECFSLMLLDFELKRDKLF